MSSIAALLQAAEYIERRERGMKTLILEKESDKPLPFKFIIFQNPKLLVAFS